LAYFPFGELLPLPFPDGFPVVLGPLAGLFLLSIIIQIKDYTYSYAFRHPHPIFGIGKTINFKID